LTAAYVGLMSLTSCRGMVGQVVGQDFVSSVYGIALPLPGDEWQRVGEEPSLLTLTHTQLDAGVTISVTCDQTPDASLDILTRHLLFGFRGVEILHQAPRVLDGVPALGTIARASLDGRPVQLHSYVLRREGCIYDLVYFAHPGDYSRGEPAFERMMAGVRFLQH
jgi:hypothetical protein